MRPPPRGLLRACERVLAPGRTSRPLRRLAAALLVAQLAWILAVPPFAGVDEFDHTYRAAAVARGEWVAPPTDATRGTGAMVTVPRDIVQAAQDECNRLPYTKPIECDPRSDADMVSVASGAGRYNPTFYFLVGTAALPFDGTTAHYVMRAAGALLCFLVLLAGMWLVSLARDRWERGWLLVGIVTALTPVALFSSAMVAPNGLEIASGITFWIAVLHLLREGEDDQPPPAGVLTTYAVVGSLLLLLRSLGPLWAVLIVLVCLVAARPTWARLKMLLWGSPRTLAATAVLVASGLAALAWTRTQHSLTIGVEDVDPMGRVELAVLVLKANVVWAFQAIAAFPTRVNLAPTSVYIAGLCLLFGLLTAMLLSSPRRVRQGVWSALWLSLLVPSVITYRTFDQYSIAWQGRYTLPFSTGIVLLCTYGLARGTRGLRADFAVAGLVVLVAMHTIGLGTMMARERGLSPGVDNGAWLLLPVWLVSLMIAVGTGLMWLTAAGQVPPREEDPDVEAAPADPQGADA